ncbi:hypothetical protein ASPCAL04390 [Aspergillus calidoustus]|uniref:Uncharacterized protein n=1 Tax=Aspergillus calidoustus TaxID=454130 RepID=A0A0U5FUM2_ASPCI|nr:hypothetical protein ASPCAL04390 [Aspergillus calidoustus]
MQGIWSRTVPAGPASHCVSCLSTAAEGVASRSTSAASRRRLRLGNSVTAFYTSIFAAAAWVDARTKVKRRLEWEEKIAAVKEEVNELVNEEQRLLEALASRASRASTRTVNPFSRALQARSYSSQSKPRNRNIQATRKLPPRYVGTADKELSKFNEQMESAVISELDQQISDRVSDDTDTFDMALDGERIPAWLETSLVRGKAIRRLALKQLAIRLLLRPAIAHSYAGVLQNYSGSDSLPKLDVASLLQELDSTRRRLNQLKSDPNHPIDDLIGDIAVVRLKDAVHESIQVGKTIRHDTGLYSNNQMPLEELLLRLSSNLLQIKDPDQTNAYKLMILAFTKTRQNDLAELVIKTILPYKFPLNASLISTILNYFRKSKDLKGFDLFLQMLRGGGYPIDMGNLAFYKEIEINGLKITVPPTPSANVVVYAVLIKACLRFDQPERADAYLSAARANGCLDDFAILMAYLEFYTIRRDWEKGLQLLQRCLAFIVSSSAHDLDKVGRLVVMMVHLSDECEKLDVSDVIIEAAINSGFDWRIAEEQADIVSNIDPDLHRWQTAARLLTSGKIESMGRDICYAFVRSVKEHLDSLPESKEESSASRLHKHAGLYSKQLLSSIMSGISVQSKTEDRGHTAQSGHLQPSQAGEFEGNGSSATSESTVTSKNQDLEALKHEVAQLRRIVFHLSRATAAQNIPEPTGNDAISLKKRLVSTVSTQDAPQQPHTLNISAFSASS